MANNARAELESWQTKNKKFFVLCLTDFPALLQILGC
jgi:hypothetical protein